MDPNNGGNQPEASLASTIASAFANFAGKSRDREKEQEGHTLPTAANSEGPSVVAVADSNQKSMAAIDNSASMSNLDAAAPTEDQVEDHSPSTDLHVENTANETQASFAKEEFESKIDIGHVEMEEETESTGVEDDPTPKQLQAVVGEQTFNVKITANDEIVVDDDDTADGDEIERIASSSTNSDGQPMESEDLPQVEEHHHHQHRTRSSSFDIAHAMVNSTNNNNMEDTTTSSSFSNPPADFADASLLLGLTDASAQPSSSKPVRGELEPATLPSAMTLFLDMLNEEQRRVRHRHIPAVEGFRKLYKSEIKYDMAAARAINKKAKRNDDSMMDVDEEGKEEQSENDVLAEIASANADAGKEDALPDRSAFVAPSENSIAFAHCGQLASLMESTPFENSMRGGMAASTLRSPQLVESLTAFNPPRPQESTAKKTKNRLKRWEDNPQDVEVDLLNYKKTVQRTRMELQRAEKEQGQIEAVTSMIRTQYMNHLDAYRDEIAAVRDQLQGSKSSCFKAAEEYNGKTISTRGSSKTMRDVFTTLKSLGDDLGAKANGEASIDCSLLPDWRVSGLGGIAATKEEEPNSSLANGWILPGDKVKTSSGDEGIVVSVHGPSLKKTLKNETEKPKDSNADVDKPKKDDDAKLNKDTPVEHMTVPAGVAVKLANEQIVKFSPSELKLQSDTFSCVKDSNLVKRWDSMKQSAIEIGSVHDYCGMNSQVIASILARQQEDDKDGSASPTSVTQYDDLRNVVPFGAGILCAPEQIKDFSSVLPLNELENNVRKVVYESGKDIQVIPAVPPSVERYESQRETMNRLKIKVLQLRNRLVRQKKIRSLNERSLEVGKKRADKVESLLVEMQTDLKSLKGRLQEELNELAIGKPIHDNSNGVTEQNNDLRNCGALGDMKGGDVPIDSTKLADQLNSSEAAPVDTPNEKRKLEDEEDLENKRARVE